MAPHGGIRGTGGPVDPASDAACDDQKRRSGHTVAVVAGPRRQVRVRKSSSRRLRDLPDLDLRTPSGRLLPF